MLWMNRACRALRDMAHSLAKTSSGKELVIEAFNDPRVVAGIDVKTGQITWQHPVICGDEYSEEFYSVEFMNVLTAGAGNLVFIPGWHEHLPGQKMPRGGFYCLNADDGKLLWKFELPRVKGVAVIISGGAVYGLDSKGVLYKFVGSSDRELEGKS
jgi:outer membrane protein assembly factor BamB